MPHAGFEPPSPDSDTTREYPVRSKRVRRDGGRDSSACFSLAQALQYPRLSVRCGPHVGIVACQPTLVDFLVIRK